MGAVDNFVQKNAYSLLALVFFAGLLYGEVKSLNTLEGRLDKKIKVMVENTDRIIELEKEVAVYHKKN